MIFLSSSCRIRVRHFPFDVQLCQMQFQSWVYSSQEVSLELRSHKDGSHGAHKDDFTESGEWDIINLPGNNRAVLIKNKIMIFLGQKLQSSDNIDSVRFDIVMRRKPLFYTVNLIIPCMLITR